jgi:hypothetical protein
MLSFSDNFTGDFQNLTNKFLFGSSRDGTVGCRKDYHRENLRYSIFVAPMR